MTLSCPLLIRRERDSLMDILSLYFHLGLLVSSVHRLVRLDGLGGVEGILIILCLQKVSDLMTIFKAGLAVFV